MKSRGVSRRTFLAGGAAAALFAEPAWKVLSRTFQNRPDLVVVHGPDAAVNTKLALAAVGGLGGIVSQGQVVHLLPNAQGSHPGTSTGPAIVKAVVELCKENGAGQVNWLSWLPERVWERNSLVKNQEETGAALLHSNSEDESLWESFEIPNGVALKKVRIMKTLFGGDLFFNMPIVKDHIGSRFTGALKNYMGSSHPLDNRPFHPTFEGEDVIHMEQCIADLNLAVRKPDLIIMDAMEILATNGPFGPGEIAKPQKVIVGFDRVAVDAYGATVLGLDPNEVTMIKKAHEHGLGEIDLSKLEIQEIEAG
jgi:uncharacterized protein (DUF362 family)